MIENDHALESLIQSPLDKGKKWSVFLEIDDGAGRSKLCTMFMLCPRKKMSFTSVVYNKSKI